MKGEKMKGKNDAFGSQAAKVKYFLEIVKKQCK
jgi:hypothetical protein